MRRVAIYPQPVPDAEESRVSFRAPGLVQGSDQSALLSIADVLYPGLVFKNESEGGLMITVPGQLGDDLAHHERVARSRFAEALGVLRAMKFGRGELQEEVVRSPAWDASGNVVVRTGTVRIYATFGDEIGHFARQAERAISVGGGLRQALVLHGKANRDAGDFYNIYELARDEFGGEDGVRSVLGISRQKQRAFTASANNLLPSDGGRHATGTNQAAVRMQLEDMAEFVAELLRSWILG